MANKENKKKSGIGLAVWVVAALLLLIVFLVTRVKMLTVLKETDFFNKVFGSEPEFITNFTPEKSSEPEAEAETPETDSDIQAQLDDIYRRLEELESQNNVEAPKIVKETKKIVEPETKPVIVKNYYDLSGRDPVTGMRK